MQNRMYLVTVVLLSILFVQCTNEATMLKNGEKSLDFEGQLMNGEHLKLADLKGNYVLLYFWGSWCAPCRKNSPKWVKLYDNLHKAKFKNAEGFEIISVGLEKNTEAWQKAIDTDGLKWKYHLLELEDSTNVKAQEIATLYRITEVPSSFLINPKGIIVGVNLSTDEVSKLLNRQIVQ